ncbi:hypothetical protein HDV00_006730 [Rhizophlyctis rosea]|nr:hypothetical protein HDV00_006730 [Rhizophlyctis rosea]
MLGTRPVRFRCALASNVEESALYPYDGEAAVLELKQFLRTLLFRDPCPTIGSICVWRKRDRTCVSEKDVRALSEEDIVQLDDRGWEKMEAGRLLRDYFPKLPPGNPALIDVLVTLDGASVRNVSQRDTLGRIESDVAEKKQNTIDLKQAVTAIQLDLSVIMKSCQAIRRSVSLLLPRFRVVRPNISLSGHDHEGYVISRPRAFFGKYGSYMRAIFPVICQALRPGNSYALGMEYAADVLEKISIPDNGTARVEQLCNAADTLVKQMNNIPAGNTSILHLDLHQYHSEFDNLRRADGLALNELKNT